MSQENVDTIRRIYERWRRNRDIDPDAFHPEFQLRTPIMQLEDRTHTGPEGYNAWRRSTEDVMADDWFEATDFSEVGECVLVTGALHLKGRGSGLEVRQAAVHIWTFRDGKPASMTACRTREEALEAVGSSE